MIADKPEWMRRFDKIHAQGKSLPKPEPGRRCGELDSSMSSDALLMNVFCAPGVAESRMVRSALGIEADAGPVFGWKARVPLANGRFDRTEVDMRWGGLLVRPNLRREISRRGLRRWLKRIGISMRCLTGTC